MMWLLCHWGCIVREALAAPGRSLPSFFCIAGGRLRPPSKLSKPSCPRRSKFPASLNLFGVVKSISKGPDNHLKNLEYRVGKLIADCAWNAAKDVTADSFQAWLRGQTELKDKTANDY